MQHPVTLPVSAKRIGTATPRASFLCNSLLSMDDVAQMRAAPHTLERKHIISNALNLKKLWPIDGAEDGVHNRKRHDVILEIFVHSWNFALTQELNDQKISTLLALVFDLISWTCLRDAPQPTMEESYSHFEAELLRHSVQNIPQSIAVFTLPEVRAIATFVLRFYLRHLSMYQYALGRTRLLQITPITNSAPGIEIYSHERELNVTRVLESNKDVPPSALILPLSTAKAYIQSEAFGCSNADSAIKSESTSSLHNREQLYPDSFHFIEEPDSQETIADALTRFPVITYQVVLPRPQTASNVAGSNSRPTSGTTLNTSTLRPLSATSRPLTSERPKSSMCSSQAVNVSKDQSVPVPVGTFTLGLKMPAFAGSSGFIKPAGFSSLPIYSKQKELASSNELNHEIVSVRSDLNLAEDRPTPVPLPTSRSIVLNDGTILQGSMPPDERLIRFVEDKVKGIVISKINERSSLASQSAAALPTSPAASPGLVARRLGQTHSVGVR